MTPSSPRRWMLIAREMGISDAAGRPSRWSADHLFVDQDSIPTIVEVKRSTNTEIRRQVVGQMLDYAANAVRYWPIDELRATFDTECHQRSSDPNTELRALLGPDADTDCFWRAVEENLTTGKIRMVFVADAIPPELQRIVEFLNEGLDRAEVYAVEVPQHLDGNGRRLLAPRLVGSTQAARIGRGERRSHPGFDAVMAAADSSVREADGLLCQRAAEVGLTTRRTSATRYFELEGRSIVSPPT